MGVSYLKPEFPPLLSPGFHPMTLGEFRAQFVKAKAFDTSLTRKGIFDGLMLVIAKLNTGKIDGEIWLDGGFVTEKIDPDDIDTLLRVSSDQYDNDLAKQSLIDWATHPDLLLSHSCDAYKWIEYTVGHPLFKQSKTEQDYWTNFYGMSRRKIPKGIVVVKLPAVMP